MNSTENLHNSAMDLAEEAFLYKKQGKEDDAKKCFEKALELEQKAVENISISKDSEPTRSILYRSAASLAYHAGDHDTADRLVANGLAGYPPSEIKEELKNLYEDINFKRHLSSKGLLLEKNQWMMSIAGNEVGYGGTSAEQLLTRVDKLSILFYRTVERLLKLPYRHSGGVNKDIKSAYGLYINAFSPGSFSVSFQIGKPDPQMEMFPEFIQRKILEPNAVVDEIFECFEIMEAEDQVKLKERFSEDAYYENFVALTKQIAPDGNNVKVVGFTSVRDGKERPVALKKKRRVSDSDQKKKDGDEKQLEATSMILSGILNHAHTPLSGKYGTVKLTGKGKGETYNIKVPNSIMKDVVQPFYEEDVIVYVTEKKNKLYLDEINLSA